MNFDNAQPQLPLGVTVSAADIDRWRSEVVEIDNSLSELTARRQRLTHRIEAAQTLFKLLDDPVVNRDQARNESAPGQSRQNDASDESQVADLAEEVMIEGGRTTMIEAVREKVLTSSVGMAIHEAKAALLVDPNTASRLQLSDKGFYRSVDRLSARGDIIRYNGRLFSPQAFARFNTLVEEGKIADQPVRQQSHSPMGDAILRVIAERPGITGGGIVAYLRQDPEFKAALTPHNSGAYNVIARLTKRRQILKSGKAYYPQEDTGTQEGGPAANG